MKNIYFNLNRLPLVCLLVLFLTVSAHAASTPLEIKCQDSAGNPVAGATVNVQQLETLKWKGDKKSDSKGITLFKLDDGAYRLMAHKEGFAPALYEFVILKGGNPVSATLKFEQGDSQKKLYFEDQAVAQKAQELLSQGSQALSAAVQDKDAQARDKKFADAEKAIEESLDIYPSNAEALFNLSIAYIQQHRWDQADESLKKTSQLLTVLSALPTPKDGKTPPYNELQQRVNSLQASLPLFKLRSDADKALTEQKFDLAAQKYSEALKLQNNDPDLYYNLSLALARARKFDDALQSIDKAVQLKPGEPAYADLRKKIVEFKESEILNKAQEILTEGDKLFQAKDYANALTKYQEALKMVPEQRKPQQAVVLAQIAKTQAQLNQYDPAVATFKKAIELAPDNASFKTALAQFYLKEKKYDEALNIYADSGSAGNQPVDQVMFKLGQTQSNQGNSEVAQLAFERAIKANPENAEAYYELGMLLYQSKKDDKRAQEVLTKYLEVGKETAHLDNTKSVLVVLKKRLK
ncbi:MAG TPA: tetratricopeptide repeat protein [Acidobacteriota bacterium]|nr:tetratricopeptide repeat protein [Acidobacteriota bacterium]